MKTFYSILNDHANTFGGHLKKHHKKYIFGALGGAILVKAITLIIAGIGINYSIDHKIFANNEGEYCYITGQYLAGGYEEGCYLTGQYLTEGTMTGCYMEGEYLTGGYLDESGNIVGQYLEGGYLTGCYMEGQELTGGYMEGCYMTGQELTGGYTVCESQSGDIVSTEGGDNQSNINNDQNVENNQSTCLFSGLNLLSPLSGVNIGGEIAIDREYCTQPAKDITVQLFDHNAQRINIATVSGNTTGIKFNSRLLSTGYSFSGENYGMYHIIGQNTSGENYYIFTGNYTGNYTDYFSEYKIRFIQEGNSIYTTDYTFSIDNKVPIANLINFNATPVYTGKVYLNSIVELIIESSEALSGVSFMVNNYAGGVTVSQSGTTYRIYQTLSSNHNSGTINYILQYYDLAGNVGTYSQTSDLIFVNNTAPSGTTQTIIDEEVGTNTTGTIVKTNTGTTKTGSNFGFVLMNEIEKFNTCKKGVSYKELKLQIHGSTYVLQMPEFQKSYVKKIINAFTLVVLSNIEKDNSLTKSDLESITSKFNNFLIVLKLVRDNDNVCKQTLSNYHINEFKTTIEKYELYSD